MVVACSCRNWSQFGLVTGSSVWKWFQNLEKVRPVWGYKIIFMTAHLHLSVCNGRVNRSSTIPIVGLTYLPMINEWKKDSSCWHGILSIKKILPSSFLFEQFHARFHIWGEKWGESVLEKWKVHVPVVIDVWVSADAILKTDVQVIPEAAVQHHVPHHANPVLQLEKETDETQCPLWLMQISKSGYERRSR